MLLSSYYLWDPHFGGWVLHLKFKILCPYEYRYIHVKQYYDPYTGVVRQNFLNKKDKLVKVLRFYPDGSVGYSQNTPHHFQKKEKPVIEKNFFSYSGRWKKDVFVPVLEQYLPLDIVEIVMNYCYRSRRRKKHVFVPVLEQYFPLTIVEIVMNYCYRSKKSHKREQKKKNAISFCIREEEEFWGY